MQLVTNSTHMPSAIPLNTRAPALGPWRPAAADSGMRITNAVTSCKTNTHISLALKKVIGWQLHKTIVTIEPAPKLTIQKIIVLFKSHRLNNTRDMSDKRDITSEASIAVSQASERFLVLSSPSPWSGPCFSPSTLLPFSPKALEKNTRNKILIAVLQRNTNMIQIN